MSDAGPATEVNDSPAEDLLADDQIDAVLHEAPGELDDGSDSAADSTSDQDPRNGSAETESATATHHPEAEEPTTDEATETELNDIDQELADLDALLAEVEESTKAESPDVDADTIETSDPGTDDPEPAAAGQTSQPYASADSDTEDPDTEKSGAEPESTPREPESSQRPSPDDEKVQAAQDGLPETVAQELPAAAKQELPASTQQKPQDVSGSESESASAAGESATVGQEASGTPPDTAVRPMTLPRKLIRATVTVMEEVLVMALFVADKPFARLSSQTKNILGCVATATFLIAILTWLAGDFLIPS